MKHRGDARRDSHQGRSRRQHWLVRMVAGGLVIAMGVVASATGYGIMNGGLALWQAELFVDDWRSSGAPPDPMVAEVATAAANRAIAAYPGPHAELWLLKGDVLNWQTAFQPVGLDTLRPLREQALDAYRLSSDVRPEHSAAWIGIARMKMELGRIDAEFEQALLKALETAPWRVYNLRQVARLGLDHWEQMGPRGRYATVVAAARTIASSSEEARALLPLIVSGAPDLEDVDSTASLAAAFGQEGRSGLPARICLVLRQQRLGDGHGLCRT